MVVAFLALLTPLVLTTPEGLGPSLARTTLTASEGTPTNSITALSYDNLGFLLVGTTGGLARYDGAKFETLYSSDHEGLDGDRIYALRQDRRGRAWVGADMAPACFYMNGAFQRISEIASLHSVSQFYESSGDEMWLVGNHLGRFVDDTLEVFGEEHGLAEGTIQHVVEDLKGNLWVGTDLGVFRFRGSNFELVDPRPSVWLTRDFGGEIWSQTPTSTLISLTGAPRPPIQLERVIIESELERKGGARILATTGGLFEMTPSNAEDGTGLQLRLMSDTPLNSDPTRAVNCLLPGSGHDLWVGTLMDGLEYVEQRSTRLTQLVETRPGLPAYHVHQLPGGRALVNGGDHLEGFILDQDGQRTRISASERGDYHSYALATTSEGTWLSTRNGLARLAGTDIIPVPEWRGLGGVLVPEANGSVWMHINGRFERVAGSGPGVNGLDSPPAGISSACIYRGSIVVATVGQILRLDVEAGEWIQLADIGTARIRHLRPGPSDELWMSSYGQGLLRLTPGGRVDQWSHHAGFTDPFLAWIAPLQGDGYLWINSNSGVLRVDIASLEAQVAGSLTSVDVRTFRAPESNGERGAVLGNGAFVLPTLEGLAIFERRLIPPLSLPPRVLIATPFVNGVRIDDAPMVRGRANLLFRFTAPIFPTSGDALFQYRMPELDKRWTDAGGAREVPFPSLPSGQYTFEVRARTSTSGWSLPTRSKTIDVPPYWHDLGWVRWLLIAGILTSIHQLVRLRTRTLAMRNSALSDEIDQRLIAEGRLQASQERFRQLFHTAPSAIVAWRPTGELLDRNERANDLFAWDHDDSVQRLPWSLFEDKELGRRVFLQVLERRVDRSLIAMARAGDFGAKRCRWQFAPTINEAGEVTSVIAMISDLSRQDRDAKSMAELRMSLVRAEESERSRIARELHDDLSQRLAALALDAHMVEQGAPYAMGSFRSKIEDISTHVHTLSRQLHPTIVDDLGLITALRSECTRRNRMGQAEISLFVDADVEKPPRDTALALFRIAQESMSNAGRHSGAQNIRVHLAVSNEESLELTIDDDGQGFDPKAKGCRSGMGLNSMRERARLAGGDLYVRSSPGQGTRVVARVPQNAEAFRRAMAIRGE